MIRKTMRIGEVRTSIKLEPEFWSYLREVAESRRSRLSTLVNEVAASAQDQPNLASTLRMFALAHARLRAQTQQEQLEKLALAGSAQDLLRVLEACPLPCLLLDGGRVIRQLNRSFSLWLNLEPKATLGQKLDNVMILRGSNLAEMWSALHAGRLARLTFNGTYVSPGKVRTAQAAAVQLSGGEGGRRPAVVLFETLAGRG